MKILTVRSSMPENGPSTQSLTIALQMRDRGHAPVFVTSGGTYVDTVHAAGIPLHLMAELAPDRHTPLSIINLVRKLAVLIRKEKPDVIHGHNAAATICAALASRLVGKKIPCVTSVRGVEERETHQWRNRIWKHTPGVLLGVCEKTRERLLGFGVPDEKIQVTYNGVDLTRFEPGDIDRDACKADFGLQGKIVVGTTGAMTGPDTLDGPTKGQHNLIKAAAKLKDKHPNLAILLIGDGPRRAMVEETAKQYNMSESVVFAGRRFDVPQLLGAMDIYCLASIWGEFFPNSIIEAMAMELPWIGSDIAGLSELTARDAAGWVSPPNDVDALAANLDRLVSDAPLRRSRGLAARQEVEDMFTITKVCDRILEAYKTSEDSLKNG